MRIDLRSLGLIGLLGGLGGAINAGLCYAWPIRVTVGGLTPGPDFCVWSIIPAGFCHGALLALVTVGVSARLWSLEQPFVQWSGLIGIGWLSGWLSWIPLEVHIHTASSFVKTSPPSLSNFVEALGWIATSSNNLWLLMGPLALIGAPLIHFGLVGALYYFFLDVCGRLVDRRLWVHLAIGSVSGVVGSLPIWILQHQWWYFSLLHGTIWGSLVGFGVWKSQQSLRRT